MRFLNDQKELFDRVSLTCSEVTTKTYSTSFSLGIGFLDPSLRDGIYSIYGFVRFADEIVDSFHHFDQKLLLDEFERDTYRAIKLKISLNPILNSFQHAVNQYGIEPELIDKFLASMRTDLTRKSHTEESFKVYVLGSAEVVGLMCLHVFCKGDKEMYEKLRPFAMQLGAAFQKINFLRDATADYYGLGRAYFPGVDFDLFDDETKEEILKEIAQDFNGALAGIRQLPPTSRFGVYVAYTYYWALFRKIKRTPASRILRDRIRISNIGKMGLLAASICRYKLKGL